MQISYPGYKQAIAREKKREKELPRHPPMSPLGRRRSDQIETDQEDDVVAEHADARRRTRELPRGVQIF